jgi:hypothetical protein
LGCCYRRVKAAGTTTFDFGRDRLESKLGSWVSVLHDTVKWQID